MDEEPGKRRARNDGDAEEKRVGGRWHVLSEEEEPQNHLQERTVQDRARPTVALVVRQQQLRRVKDGKALVGEYVITLHKPSY